MGRPRAASRSPTRWLTSSRKAGVPWPRGHEERGACYLDEGYARAHALHGLTVTEHTPYIDYENLPAPSEGFIVTQFITVRSVARSRAFYSEVLGGQVVLEENPCMVKLSNSWVIMNPGGGPTPDKPDISVVDYEPGNTVSTFMNLRVADIQACYEEWSSKGAEFVTPPIDRGAEIRCYMRDPDGYLIEVGQSTGLLEGRLAKKRPEDLPG